MDRVVRVQLNQHRVNRRLYKKIIIGKNAFHYFNRIVIST